MADDTTSVTQSRRRLLTAAAAAGAAALAASLPGAEKARATDGQAVAVGGSYSGTSLTELNVTGAGCLWVQSDAGYALHAVSTSGTGVQGLSTSQSGVYGQSSSGEGVHGESVTGDGVYGVSASGVGVHAAGNGIALQVEGKVRLSRSGRKAIASGHSSLKVTMAGVTTSSYVVATLQTNRSGFYVQSAVPASGSFTIYLNKAVPSPTYVGYLVIN